MATQLPADHERASAQREQAGTGGCHRTEGRRLEENGRSRAHRDARRHRRLGVRWAQGFVHRLWQLPFQGPAEAGGAKPQNWGEDDRRGGETGAEASNAPTLAPTQRDAGALLALSLSLTSAASSCGASGHRPDIYVRQKLQRCRESPQPDGRLRPMVRVR